MLEPCMSLLGALVYGVFHTEPIAITKRIQWLATNGRSPDQIDYYIAQGNATRIFVNGKYETQLKGWNKVETIRLSALAYAASGGYSVAQLYPTGMLPILKGFEKALNLFPPDLLTFAIFRKFPS